MATIVESQHLNAVASFAQAFSDLQYDRGIKELQESEKRLHAHLPLKWPSVYSILIRLATAEKSYMELAFLMPRGFLRKENTLKTQYENLSQDLSALSRRKLMQFYEKCYVVGNTVAIVNYEELLETVQSIKETFEGAITMNCLRGIKNALEREDKILQGLLAGFANMNHINFTDALISLSHAKGALKEWEDLVRRLHEGIRWYTYFATQQDPHLFQWLVKLADAAVSKFSLYFESFLSKQAAESVHKANKAKLKRDLVAEITSFQRKWDGVSMFLMFDATDDPLYKGQGFQSPDTLATSAAAQSSTQGGELETLYPCVFSSTDCGHEDILPNIVLLLVDERWIADKSLDSTLQLVEDLGGFSYFLQQVNSRMTLVATFNKKPDSQTAHSVLSFMKDLTIQIRCTQVFATIKPVTKYFKLGN